MKVLECCKGCKERHPLCHADCPKKAAADAEREAMKQAKAGNIPIMAYSRDKKEIVNRKRRRHQKL